MSNSRIFCWVFLIASGLIAIAALFGMETRHTGVDAMVGKFVLCATFGIIAVALFGDREKGDPA